MTATRAVKLLELEDVPCPDTVLSALVLRSPMICLIRGILSAPIRGALTLLESFFDALVDAATFEVATSLTTTVRRSPTARAVRSTAGFLNPLGNSDP